MGELGVDVVLLSVGPDLPYLIGYEAMPLERLTMLVLPREGDAHLVVPRLEAPRVEPCPDLFDVVAWEETDDPIAQVACFVGPAPCRVAIGDHTWARFVLDLQRALPAAAFVRASEVVGPIRMVRTRPRSTPSPRRRGPSTGSRPTCAPSGSQAGPSSTSTASSSTA
jgi:Xaa-Pro aminopeptidase